MTLYGFKDKNIAERLRQIGAMGTPLEGDQGLRVTDVYVFKAPTAGIPAAAAGVMGKATCEAFFLSVDESDDASFAALTDSGGSQIEVTVRNPEGAPIVGGMVFQAVVINEEFVANLPSPQRLWKYTLTEDSAFPGPTTATLKSLGDDAHGAIDLNDPMGVTQTQLDGDSGFCIYEEGGFHAIMPGLSVVQTVTDFTVGTSSITIERKNLVTFGSEDVTPDEVITGATCS